MVKVELKIITPKVYNQALEKLDETSISYIFNEGNIEMNKPELKYDITNMLKNTIYL